MKVVIDTSYVRRGPSGTATYLEQLVPALRSLGIDVREVAERRPHRYTNLAAEAAWQLRVARAARGADVLHHPLPALIPGVRTPQVVTVHDLAFLRVPECFRARFRAQAVPRHRRAARSAAAVVVPSAATAADLRALWAVPAENIVVAPHGPGRAPAPERSGARHFLYVGDAEPRKNLDRLLAAHAQYRAGAGAGALPLVLAGPAHGHRTGPGVTHAPDPDLPELLAHAAALVFPSLYEGFGLPALEAMHAGTPVLAARTAGLAEVCADAARYCDPRDPESIAAGLAELAATPPLREELRRRGQARAAQFAWESCARAHVDAYTLATRT